MKNEAEVKDVITTLMTTYPDAKAELDYKTPFELMIAVVLSAQCTDVRVNKVTAELFKTVAEPQDVLDMGLNALEEAVKTCGLYKAKAGNIHKACQILVSEYGSKLPEDRDELMKLPGVGRKSANVIVSNAFGVPAIAVDTHVFRVSNRIGLAHGANVDQTERQLMLAIPKEDWTFMHHVLIFHGRRTCKARNPECDRCTVIKWCEDHAARSTV